MKLVEMDTHEAHSCSHDPLGPEQSVASRRLRKRVFAQGQWSTLGVGVEKGKVRNTGKCGCCGEDKTKGHVSRCKHTRRACNDCQWKHLTHDVEAAQAFVAAALDCGGGLEGATGLADLRLATVRHGAEYNVLCKREKFSASDRAAIKRARKEVSAELKKFGADFENGELIQGGLMGHP
jgi:hypothetical protein